MPPRAHLRLPSQPLTRSRGPSLVPNRAPKARPAVRGSEKATRALKISGAPFPNARKVTPWGDMSRGSGQALRLAQAHLPAPTPSGPPSRVPELDQKDTATLCESFSVVEMADRLGQKLRRKGQR